jgi:hypothetical protein
MAGKTCCEKFDTEKVWKLNELDKTTGLNISFWNVHALTVKIFISVWSTLQLKRKCTETIGIGIDHIVTINAHVQIYLVLSDLIIMIFPP